MWNLESPVGPISPLGTLIGTIRGALVGTAYTNVQAGFRRDDDDCLVHAEAVQSPAPSPAKTRKLNPKP